MTHIDNFNYVNYNNFDMFIFDGWLWALIIITIIDGFIIFINYTNINLNDYNV